MVGGDTIFAVSSGAPPAAIAIVRISGPNAVAAATALAGRLPPPRRAGRRRLHSRGGDPLDDALVLVFPGPGTATGEDIVELHLHGGRAVVRAVLAALGDEPGLRPAAAGEFTRRALANGVIDLAQAEGLGDLLQAETEAARRAALANATGAVGRDIGEWRDRLLALAARTEAALDFADEDDVPADADAERALRRDVAVLATELADAASRPAIERLRDGITVVFAGPPNSGKSSLVNAMAEREVAIATSIPGTTRDVIEASVVRRGVAWRLIDVAGLRDEPSDPVEAIGMARARGAIAEADLVLWLGDEPPPEPRMIAIHARFDLPDRAIVPAGRIAVSVHERNGVAALWDRIEHAADAVLPDVDRVVFNQRQRERIGAAAEALGGDAPDLILLAENLRTARAALEQATGAQGVEALLDVVFAGYCIGK